LNCVYCEVGETTNLTIERKEYVPINDVLNELDHFLNQNPTLDFITFSGAGEPTLNSGIGKVITFLKERYPNFKLALLTNSTLLYNENVRNEINRIDVLLPSLDTVSEDIFKKINRPNSQLDINKIIEGLIKYRKKFKGKIWLEIFIVPEINDTEEELSLLRKTIRKINPEKIQLNTLDRPGTESWVKTATKERLEYIVNFLKPLPVEIIAKFNSRQQIKSFNKNIENQILETIRRRPCTDKDLTEMLGIHLNELNKYLNELLNKNLIKGEIKERGTFFKMKK
jgi:wyosine [tRNA(Phe)-imidazoG37] synthetase (radical SAM superfamily)